MIFETIHPPGKYFGINICSRKLIKHMEESHRSLYKTAKIKFFIVPKAYFVKNNHYNVILELKALYKSNTQYFFTAENMMLKFKMRKDYRAYNANKSPEINLIDIDTMVQFFECPKETNDTTCEKIKREID